MEPKLEVSRPEGSVGGRAFMAQFMDTFRNPPKERVSFPVREEAMLQQLLAGNIPDFLHTLCPVEVQAGNHTATFWVAPDYLALGSDGDFVLTPLGAHTAQEVADHYGCALPCKKMVDLIYKAAEVKVAAQGWGPPYDGTMQWTYRYVGQSDRILKSFTAKNGVLGQLTAGHKKDVVVCAKLANPSKKVAIYGWQQANGVPIQGPTPNSSDHDVDYADYSHGIRLVWATMLVDGEEKSVAEVLADPEIHTLLSDEGVISHARY